jgi:hypothetical protein
MACLFNTGETMRLAKTIASAAAIFGLATGSALAGEGGFGMNDEGSSMGSSSQMAQDETYILLEPVDVSYYDVYGVDENGDGVTDGYLFIDQSDTLG